MIGLVPSLRCCWRVLVLVGVASAAHRIMANETQLIDLAGAAGDQLGGPLINGRGSAVAVDGSVIVVGSPLRTVGANSGQGVAKVFRFDGVTWNKEQELTAAEGEAGDGFGHSVAVNNNVIVVGAPFDDIGTSTAQGSARVFRWDGVSWIEEQTLTAGAGATLDFFGSSVSLDAGVIVVGAPSATVAGTEGQGTATVFRSIGGAWVEEQQLVLTLGEAFDRFGNAVAVSDDVIVVGTIGDDVAFVQDAGSATVFRWNGSSWDQEQQLSLPGGQAFEFFGAAVAVDNGVVVVGAPSDKIGATINQGSATVYRWDGANWNKSPKLLDATGFTSDLLGTSVSVSGNVVVVGAPGDDLLAGTNQGSALVFQWNGTNWIEQALLSTDQGATGDSFGTSIALCGNTVVVGAPRHDTLGDVDRGAAYAFELPPFADLGFALAGSAGTPVLSGSGSLMPGTSATLSLTVAPPAATTHLVVGFSGIFAPFKDGVLVPSPDVLLLGLTVDASGTLALSFPWPNDIPAGTAFTSQHWIEDPSGPSPLGFAASNGLLGVAR